MPLRLDGGLDPRVVGRHDDARRAGLHGALRDPHHHRLAGDIRQRLAGKARRRVARGDDDGELTGHSYSAWSSLRASSSSITGMPFLIG